MPGERGKGMGIEAEKYMRELDEEQVLRTLIESTSSVTGKRFFYAIVENLSKALGKNARSRHWRF